MSNPFHDAQVRLECLRLAYRPGLSPHEVIAAARDYLAWAAGASLPITPMGPADGAKEHKPAPATDKPSAFGAASRGK